MGQSLELENVSLHWWWLPARRVCDMLPLCRAVETARDIESLAVSFLGHRDVHLLAKRWWGPLSEPSLNSTDHTDEQLLAQRRWGTLADPSVNSTGDRNKLCIE